MSRYYQNAADAVRTCRNGKSFKKHFADREKAGTREYAIAAETIKYMNVIESLISKCGITSEKIGIQDPDLYFVLLYELLFSADGKIQGGGAVKKAIIAHEAPLRAALEDICKEKNVSINNLNELLPSSLSMVLPRYIRLNYMKCNSSRDEVLAEVVSDYCPDAVADPLIPSLIKLPASVKALPSLHFVRDSEVIIQDKASCIPSQVLADEWILNANSKSADATAGGDIVDACSAPGNKTSHVASELVNFLTLKQQVKLQQNSQKNSKKKVPLSDTGGASVPTPVIYAFEKDAKRYELLCGRMAEANAMGHSADIDTTAYPNVISAQHADFLMVDVTAPEYANVQYILLDPSCSGSGTNSRTFERNLNSREKTDSGSGRVSQLAAFQTQLTKKAMTFPNVHTIVYSTCSVHWQENEGVVADILSWCRQKQQEEKVEKSESETEFGFHYDAWELKTPSRFPLSAWQRRGLANPEPRKSSPAPDLTDAERDCVIRCLPDDEMNGFYVTLYVNPVKRARRCSAQQLARRATLLPISFVADKPKTGGKQRDSSSSNSDSSDKQRGNKRAKHIHGIESYDNVSDQQQTYYPPPYVKPVKAAPNFLQNMFKPKSGKKKKR